MQTDTTDQTGRAKHSRASSRAPGLAPAAHFGREYQRSLAAAFGGLMALAFALAVLSGCGGNSTAIGVNVSSASQPNLGTSPQSPVKVQEGGTETFTANVTGGSTTTVYWQICLPEPVTNPPKQPATCTPIPGVTTSNSSSSLSGYGLITPNGVYTAPTSLPQSNPFEIVATSTVQATAFGVNYVTIDSGIRVQMIPTGATIGTNETYAVIANVTGTSNTAVTWSVSSMAGGSATDGTIAPGGALCASQSLTPGENCATYTAPSSTVQATVTATSSADPSQSGSLTINVSTGSDPVIASLEPNTAQQGSVQQDIYLAGSDFLSTSQIVANGSPVPTTWLSSTLMRAAIPASLFTASGAIAIAVDRQNGDTSSCTAPAGCAVTVSPMRPSLVASSPDSVIATPAGFGINLTGGYFTQGATAATFDGFPGTGSGTPAPATFSNSRQMTADIPAGALSTPGLYPLVLQNTNLAGAVPSTSATNVAVTPAAGTLVTSPVATLGVGATPSAIAVDETDGLAVVANTGANSVSVINLATNAVVQTVAVGKAPSSVAVDDALPHPVAVVVNSGDGTLSAIDLVSDQLTGTVSLPALPPPQPNEQAPVYYAVGINPVTHRGLVAAASTNVFISFDLSTGTPVPALGASGFALLGGSNTSYGTGPAPQIAVDPRLNWAVVTAGGGGLSIVNFVDLGNNSTTGVDPGLAASVIGELSLAGQAQGIGINPETHQVLLTTPALGNFTTFSLLDQSVSTIPFTNQNVTVDEPGYVAAAASALPNIGVAVNTNGNDAAILDLQNHLVIEKVAVGHMPAAVAVDPVTNEALVANQGDGTVSVLSLGTVRSSASLGSSEAPQITLSSPEITDTSTSPLTLTVNGGGFASGAQVYLDGTAVPSAINSSARQITATVPASMLSSARRYSVYVQNPGQTVISNIEDLTVVQAIPVGAQPFGVALDRDCDVAAVTNAGDNTVSIIALTANSAPTGKTCVSASSVGTVGPPVPVGNTPEGIAIDPVLGLAVIANSGSLDASVVDLTGTNPPAPVSLACNSCSNITGVGMNLDSGIAYVTATTSSTLTGTVTGTLNGIKLPDTGLPSGATGSASISGLDAVPQAVAVDDDQNYLGVAVGGQTSIPSTSVVDLYNVNQGPPVTRALGFNLPTGIIFDPLNQVFVAANSLQNSVGFVDPLSGTATFAQVGMNPTALDYNDQTSTLVTANNASKTMSILEYVCPPGIGPNCSAPQVRDILGIGGSPQFSVAIDPRLNLAVLTDEANNRVLLVPLP